MLRAGINAQIAELHAAKRTARNHALDRLLDHAFRKPALEDRFCGTLLDTANEPGVVVINLVLALATGQHRMSRVDDDDMVTAIDMGRVSREVLTAKAHRDQGSEPPDHQTFGVDQHPLLRHLGRLCRKGFHVRESVKGDIGRHARRTAGFLDEPGGARQYHREIIKTVKTMVYKYGAILPNKSS